MFRKYPKTARLKDGRCIELRPMKVGDREHLTTFFQQLGPEERNLLNDDVNDPAFIDRLVQRLGDEWYIVILAIADGVVVGEANLSRRRYGWSRHVGKIRILTDPKWRRIGLGTLLAKEIFFLAVKLKLEKVNALMMEEQMDARHVFARLGFQEEAILKDQVVDIQGQKHNLVIMGQSIPEVWERIQDMIDESVMLISGS